MRRKGGDALVRNEERVLAAAVALLDSGEREFHGYRLVKGFEPDSKLKVSMSTLYRCISRLEERKLLKGKWRAPDGDPEARPVKYFHLTAAGVKEARNLDVKIGIKGAGLKLLKS